MKTELERAFKTLKQALKDDPDYAHSWHCNLAMAFYDSMDDIEHPKNHKIANEGAQRFMKNCFDVETSNDMLSPKKEVKLSPHHENTDI